MAVVIREGFISLLTSNFRYLGLIKDDGREVSGGDYVRKPISFNVSEDANYYYLSNSNDILFPVATIPYGWVAKIGIYDSVSDGNLLITVDLPEAKYVDANKRVVFLAGHIRIRVPKEVV